MIVLGVETSCDETGVALYDSDKGLLAHALHSQIELHTEYGGVVPELASRDHVRKVLPLTESILHQANLSLRDLDGIAYTAGPGLMGALFVGGAVARSLAFGLGIPAVEVHHMEGHLLAPMLETSRPEFPFIALLVSGGHTQLVRVDGVGEYQMLGESLDDAAGEAFDKAAKMLGLSYPGGPAVAKLAELGNPDRFRFPRPMTDRPGLDFSFSGLKTFCLNTIEAHGGDQIDEQTKADVAYAFQEAVVETLRIKCIRALKETGLSRLVLAGGVSANKLLRIRLKEHADKLGAELFYPANEFCTDNGAMIAYTGCLRLMAGQSCDLKLKVHPRWSMEQLPSLK